MDARAVEYLGERIAAERDARDRRIWSAASVFALLVGVLCAVTVEVALSVMPATSVVIDPPCTVTRASDCPSNIAICALPKPKPVTFRSSVEWPSG